MSPPILSLFRNDIDLAIVSSPNRQIQVDNSRFRCRRLIRDEFVALLPADHEKARKSYLVAEDIIDETYITNSALPEKNREYELFFQPHSIYPERVVQVGFTGAILELVAAGIGTTIITRWIMESDEIRSNVVSLPLTKKGLYVHWFAICSRKSEIDVQARTLCALIAEESRVAGP